MPFNSASVFFLLLYLSIYFDKNDIFSIALRQGLRTFGDICSGQSTSPFTLLVPATSFIGPHLPDPPPLYSQMPKDPLMVWTAHTILLIINMDMLSSFVAAALLTGKEVLRKKWGQETVIPFDWMRDAMAMQEFEAR